MRICGGFFGGRRLAVPKTGDIRPTQECVREALFSMLMNCIDDLKFLDLFACSGAVGLEALSRGAAAVTVVEKNPIHAAAITKNAGVI
ncbi:MAG: RsmD family RNA methyltransferase, partial [Kiritimatiellae bacterium]|nr:RsmD family RNA methyltransferase [Kiritimatiellia bacterium]